MTVSADPATVTHTGSGSTGPFTIPFYFMFDEWIRAVKTVGGTSTLLVLDVDYTLTGALHEEGGALTLAVALETEQTLTITMDVPINQLTDWQRNDPFPAEAIERAVDKLTMICKQLEASFLDFNDADLEALITLLLTNQDFIDLLTQLITNTFDETDYILQLGMLRFLIPIKSISDVARTVDKTYESALTLCTNAAAVTVTIRENDGDADADFHTGSFMSFKQTTVGGQVTLVAPALSTFTVPYGFLPKTRALNSIITATCELGSVDGSTWTLSGDLAVDSAASVGQACTALAIAAGVVTMDCSLGDFFTLDMTENVTSWVFTNLPDDGFAFKPNVRIHQHASSAKTLAWPAAFKWVGGAPTLSATLDSYSYLTFPTFDQGTRYEAALSGPFA